MKKTTGLLILLLIILASIVILAMYEAEQLRLESFSSTYVFEITFETDATLRNVTLIIPLPEKKGPSLILEELLAGNVYGKPEGWNVTVVEKNGIKMLQILADEIIPIYHHSPIPITSEGGNIMNVSPEFTVSGNNSPSQQILTPVQLTVTAKSNLEIETRYPLEHEPLLSPRSNITEIECIFPSDTTLDQTTCFEYDSLLYSSYNSSGKANISMDISLTGRNEWWAFGWSFNEYRDRIHANLTSGLGHWQVIRGDLIQGIGRYP